MWTQEERKAYNDAKEKKIQDLKDAKYKKRAIADTAPAKSKEYLTPDQRFYLQEILRVSKSVRDKRFVQQVLRFKKTTVAQRAVLNEIYKRNFTS